MTDKQDDIRIRLQRGLMQAKPMTDEQEIELARLSQNAAWLRDDIGMQNAAPYSKLSDLVIPEKRKTFFERVVDRFR